jgi:hypothetical protein
MLSAALRVDKARTPQDLQVARGVGEAEARPRGKFFDAALALREVFQQFQPMRVTERLGHLSEAGEDRLFWSGA